MSWTRKAIWFLAGIAIVVLLAVCAHSADARDALTVRIPATSLQYRHALEQSAGERFGLNAPVARLAAQLQQESGWNPKARSPYAEGLAQFTPPTAQWLPEICPSIGAPDPWDPGWSIRAQTCYDAWLYSRAPGDGDCARWAMTLSAYNGGEAARDRERTLAERAGADPGLWFHQVADFRSRSMPAWRENRQYVWRILTVLEPAYIAAGWPGTAACTYVS